MCGACWVFAAVAGSYCGVEHLFCICAFGQSWASVAHLLIEWAFKSTVLLLFFNVSKLKKGYMAWLGCGTSRLRWQAAIRHDFFFQMKALLGFLLNGFKKCMFAFSSSVAGRAGAAIRCCLCFGTWLVAAAACLFQMLLLECCLRLGTWLLVPLRGAPARCCCQNAVCALGLGCRCRCKVLLERCLHFGVWLLVAAAQVALQGAAVKVRCHLSPLQGATVRVLLSECCVCLCFASLPLSRNMQMLRTNTVCHFRVYAGIITFL